MSHDLVVIGGGPGGYVAAIRAAQLGRKVAVVEVERAGGTCLNWGCIPTKALLRNAHLFHTVTHQGKEFGLSFENLSYDWEAVIKRSRTVADRLAGGVEFLFRKNKIDYHKGFGSILEPGKVEVRDGEGATKVLESSHLIIATGARSRELPGRPFNGTTVIGSREATVLGHRPESMIIIGAGAIGVEFAYIYNAFGTRVTLVEMLPSPTPGSPPPKTAAIRWPSRSKTPRAANPSPPKSASSRSESPRSCPADNSPNSPTRAGSASETATKPRCPASTPSGTSSALHGWPIPPCSKAFNAWTACSWKAASPGGSRDSPDARIATPRSPR